MPSMEGGGVEKNIILIANYLSKRKEVILITYDNKFNKFFNNKVKIINVTKKIQKVSKYYKYFFCILILVKNLIANKTLVFSFQANIYCLILCNILRNPIIIRSNSSPSGWTKNIFKKFIFKFFFKRSNEIIVNSFHFKNELDKKFGTNSKIILNPLNKKEILRKSKKNINFNFFTKKDLKIINIARFTNQKDHLTLLKAFNIVSKKINSKLLIIGYGKNENLIKEFMKKNDLERKVLIMHYKQNPYVYIKKSDLFVLTSKYEGLPNVLLESMVLKKFIISSDCPTGPKEILDNGKYGFLFKIGDFKSLAKKIIQYKNNKKKLKKKIKDGFLSLKKYEFNLNCKKYEEIIEKYL